MRRPPEEEGSAREPGKPRPGDSGAAAPSLNDIVSLLSELFPKLGGLITRYPQFALPTAAIVVLAWLAPDAKTFMKWVYDTWKVNGVVAVVGAFVATVLLLVWWLRVIAAPRPVIEPFPAHQLSKSPILKWKYEAGNQARASYQVRIWDLDSGKALPPRPVPERMQQHGLDGITGRLRIRVHAVVDGKVRRASAALVTEIYENSVERIRRTGRLRVGVHSDPGEEIFCFLRDGMLQGFDIDLAYLIASELQEDADIETAIGVQPVFRPWPEIIGAPNEHEIDMSIASISVSKERMKRYDIEFSTPYAVSDFGVVAYSKVFSRGAARDRLTLEALKGKTVGVHAETTACAFLDKVLQNRRYTDIERRVAVNNDELRKLLRDRAVNAIVHDYQRAFTLVERDAIVYHLDHDLKVARDEYGIAFSSVNSALRLKVDTILARHRRRIAAMLAHRIDRKLAAIIAQMRGPRSAQPRPGGKINLFVYGSLMFDEVWKRLVSGDFERTPARLAGYRRLKIKNEEYPGLVKDVGVVRGILCKGVDEQTMKRLDEFEADCYERVDGVVLTDDGKEIPAAYYEVKDTHRGLLEQADWDEEAFRRAGLARFIDGYRGFRQGAATAQGVSGS